MSEDGASPPSWQTRLSVNLDSLPAFPSLTSLLSLLFFLAFRLRRSPVVWAVRNAQPFGLDRIPYLLCLRLTAFLPFL